MRLIGWLLFLVAGAACGIGIYFWTQEPDYLLWLIGGIASGVFSLILFVGLLCFHRKRKSKIDVRDINAWLREEQERISQARRH